MNHGKREVVTIERDCKVPYFKKDLKENLSSTSGCYKRVRAENGIKTIHQADINEMLRYVSSVKRAREPILINDSFDEVPQKFINCLDPRTYVRPHMHIVPKTQELMCWLTGEIVVLLFDTIGKVTHRIVMNQRGVKVLEIPAFCYHAFIATEQSAYLEIRNTPYHPSVRDRTYSDWSPEEYSIAVKEYKERFLIAKVGDLLVI